MANDWRVAQVREVEKGLQGRSNIHFFNTDAQGETARSILNIENMIEMDVDILIASPRDAKVMTPALDKAHEKGIKVVLLSRRGTSEKYTSFIHPDNEKIARHAARFIAGQLRGKGNILILQGVPTASTAIIRTNAFLEEMKQYPDLHIVAIKPANYLRSDAAIVMEEVIGQGLEFDVIYAQSDSMAGGARMAMEKAGLDPADCLIVGIDYIAEAREAIKNKRQSATFTYPTGGRECAEIILDIVQGKDVPREIILDSVLVTSENVHLVDPVF